MNVLDKSIVEAIRSAYAAPTPEGISSKSDERQGVMARTQSRVSKALKDTAQDAMASIQNLVGKTMEARTDKDVSMEDLAKQSAEENAKYRESMGITQSLTSSGGMLSTKDDQESAPVTAETEDMGLDDDAMGLPSDAGLDDDMGLPSDAGLMTRPKARPELNNIDDVSKRYGSTVGDVMKEFETVEGLEPHIGKDWENVTLAYGIVPDKGLKIDGLDVPDSRDKRGVWLKKNGYIDAAGKATAKFAKAAVDTSNVSKEGIDRNLFNSDLEWTAAVVNEFNKKVAEAYDIDTLSEEAKKGLLDIAWNGGAGSLGWSGIKAWVAEANKAPEDRVTDNVLELTKHNTESKKPVRGLVARRSRMANTLLPIDEQVSFIEQRGKEIKLFTQDGTLLKTIKTKNAPSSPDGWIDINGNDLGVEALMFSPRPKARP